MDEKISIPTDGRWLLVKNGNHIQIYNVDDKTLIDSTTYLKLQRDMHFTSQVITELSERLKTVYGECDVSRLNDPLCKLSYD